MRISPTRAGAIMLAASGCLMHAAVAQTPIQVELLTPVSEFTDNVAIQIRNKFNGDHTKVLNLRDASHIAVARITIQPNAVFPWHTHPGPVLITVVEGDFTYILAADCLAREYSAGETLVDPGFENVHTAYNPSKIDPTVVLATFLGLPAAGPLTIAAPGPDPDACPLPFAPVQH